MRWLKAQSGVTSLVAVSIVALIIIAITIPLSGLMTGELRHAIDSENSTKAYYEAESGAEQAVLYINNYLKDPAHTLAGLNQGCQKVDPTNPAENFFSADNSAVTCARIIAAGDIPVTDLPEGSTKEYDLTDLTYDRIEILWGPLADGSDARPLLEATISNFDPARTDSTLKMGTMLLDPSKNCGASPCPGKPMWYPVDDSSVPTQADLSTGIATRPGSETPYTTVITHNTPPGFAAGSAFNSVLRLRARSFDAKFKVNLWNGNTKVDAIPLSDTRVDVTAKVGESFRRVELDVPSISTAFPGDVIFSDTSVCKDFSIASYPGYQEVFGGSCPIN